MYKILINKISIKTGEKEWVQIDKKQYRTKEVAKSKGRMMFGDNAELKIEEINQ